MVQYVFSALGHLGQRDSFDLTSKTIGVVGVGNVGSRVAAFAEKIGMRVLRNDPPLALRDGADAYVSLETIKNEADIITFHTPLTTQGPYPTFHLFGDDFMSDLKKEAIIINASRGEVCANQSLIEAKQKSVVSSLVIDCWEQEPSIDRLLLSLVDIGTFHIAGYSLEGKANATTAAVRAVSTFFDLNLNEWQVALPPLSSQCHKSKSILDEVVCSYPIMKDDEALRLAPENFEELRGTYDFRRQPLCI